MTGIVIKIAGLVLGLGAILLALSCAPGRQNGNQNQDGTIARPDNVNAALVKPDRDPTCNIVDLENRRSEVEKKINAKIEDDDDLEKMLKGHDGKPKRFEFSVTKVQAGNVNFLEAQFKGVITQNDQLDDLVDRLDNFLFEGCVHKVTFGPPGDPPATSRVTSGFEWHYCDYPNVACSDGACRERCDSVSMNGNGNTNSNTNTNANGSNTNYNANRSNVSN